MQRFLLGALLAAAVTIAQPLPDDTEEEEHWHRLTHMSKHHEEEGPRAYWYRGLPKQLWPKKTPLSAHEENRRVEEIVQDQPKPFWSSHVRKSNLPELVLEHAREVRRAAGHAAIWHDKKLLERRERLLKAQELRRMSATLLRSAQEEGALARHRFQQAAKLMTEASVYGARSEKLKVAAEVSHDGSRGRPSTMMLDQASELEAGTAQAVKKRQVDALAKKYERTRSRAGLLRKRAKDDAASAARALLRSRQEAAKAAEDGAVNVHGEELVDGLKAKLAQEKHTIEIAQDLTDEKMKQIVEAGASVRKAREESELALAEYKVKHAAQYTAYAASLAELSRQDAASASELSAAARKATVQAEELEAAAARYKVEWDEKSSAYSEHQLTLAESRRAQLVQLNQANAELASAHQAALHEHALRVQASKQRELGEAGLGRAKKLYAAATQLRAKSLVLAHEASPRPMQAGPRPNSLQAMKARLRRAERRWQKTLSQRRSN
jgi:hypothetical protein